MIRTDQFAENIEPALDKPIISSKHIERIRRFLFLRDEIKHRVLSGDLFDALGIHRRLEIISVIDRRPHKRFRTGIIRRFVVNHNRTVRQRSETIQTHLAFLAGHLVRPE